MKIKFHKYTATGNDFVMIDDRNESFDISDQKLIARMCDRRFGIGADGLILLRNHPRCDFKMIYFNADGSESTLCGNGGRAIVRFAENLGLLNNNTTDFEAVDGIHRAFFDEEKVALDMHDVNKIEHAEGGVILDTGSPQFVIFVNNLKELDVYTEGHRIRNNARFSEKGINVNFVEAADNFLNVRTYERGVEAETFSCGTGVTASALAAVEKGAVSPVAIKTKGGELSIEFERKEKKFTNIRLIGPARYVFKGSYKV